MESKTHFILEQGMEAPDFDGTNQNGHQISLSMYEGSKIVLFFYPKDSTPGCTIEVQNLRDNYNKLKKAGYVVIGVSADSIARHKKFIEKYNLPFDLIADEEKVIISSYGVWGPKKFMGREYEGIHRTTFLIDEAGVVESIIRKVKTKEHAQQIFALTN